MGAGVEYDDGQRLGTIGACLGECGVDDGTGLREREGHAAISCRAVPAISASRRAISSAGAPVPKT